MKEIDFHAHILPLCDLVSLGACVQLNVSSCCGLFVESRIKKLLASGCVTAWGSDIHGAKEDSYAKWVKCRKRRSEWSEVMSAANGLPGIQIPS